MPNHLVGRPKEKGGEFTELPNCLLKSNEMTINDKYNSQNMLRNSSYCSTMCRKSNFQVGLVIQKSTPLKKAGAVLEGRFFL